MIKRLTYLFIFFLLSSHISYATDIYCSFTERNADYNNILGRGMITYDNALFSFDDKTKMITYSPNKIPVEVLAFTDKVLKFKMNINIENSENSYIVTISRVTGAIKTVHHQKLQMQTYNPLYEYHKNTPKYSPHIIETDFYGNGTCSKQVKSTVNKF